MSYFDIIQDALTVAEEKNIRIKPRNVFKTWEDSELSENFLSSQSQDDLRGIRKDSLTFERSPRKSTKKKHLFRLNTMDTMWYQSLCYTSRYKKNMLGTNLSIRLVKTNNYWLYYYVKCLFSQTTIIQGISDWLFFFFFTKLMVASDHQIIWV